VQLRLSTGMGAFSATPGMADAQLDIITKDPARCFSMGYQTAVTINGVSMGLTDGGGLTHTESGSPVCLVPQYKATAAIPLAGVASLRLSDDSATWGVESAEALVESHVRLTSPADGVLHPRQDVALEMAAASTNAFHASVGFVADADPQ